MPQAVDDSPPVNEVEKKDNNKIGEVSQTLNELNLQEITDEQFPFLKLPDDCIRLIYPYFDIASRRVLRENGRLAEIESEAKYRYGTIKVTMESDGFAISSGGAEYKIPHSDVEKEFELLGKNTYFDEVIYKSSPSVYEWSEDSEVSWQEQRQARRQICRNCIDFARFLKAKKITVDYGRFNDDNLKSIVQNREEVIIKNDSDLDDDGYMWLYEMMLNGKLDVKKIKIESSSMGERGSFMEELGEYDEVAKEFYTDNPDQQVVNGDDSVTITEGHLKIIINGLICNLHYDSASSISWPDCFYEHNFEVGFISFEIIEEEKKVDNT